MFFTKVLKTIPRTSALLSYPLQAPSVFSSVFRRSNHQNCLSYALRHRLPNPPFIELQLRQHINRNDALEYFKDEINKHFNDFDFIKSAPVTSGTLPSSLPQYYIIALLLSYRAEPRLIYDKPRKTLFDYHFLVQNDDGSFSHRRGGEQVEHHDSEGTLITAPELAKFTYLLQQSQCFDYQFIGYLYVKCTSYRKASMQENNSKPERDVLLVDKKSVGVQKVEGLKNYPVFNPRFVPLSSALPPTNCLSYALNINIPGPDLELLSIMKAPGEQLDYVVKSINDYFSDQELALVAPYVSGQLPLLKTGYYTASLHYSQKMLCMIQGDYYSQCEDFHFIVQNNDGGFSHRSGSIEPPDRNDSLGKPITLPEFTTLCYTYKFTEPRTNLPGCLDYHFVGYLYFKTVERRLGILAPNQSTLEEGGAKEKKQPVLPQRLSTFNGGLFSAQILRESNEIREKFEPLTLNP
jgi:hypothetical protein